jgi:DinB superfamily
MKLLLALTLIVAASPLAAQAPAAAPTANPIVWSANQLYARQSKFIVAAAEEMPADKLSYKPTPDQLTYGRIIAHLATSNGSLCGMISGNPAPAAVKVAETASKEELVAALKTSFDFCDSAMAGLTDAKLTEMITFRGAQVPRARALFELSVDLFDHYSQMAGYLRLNGLLPPSAAPKK